MLTTIYPIGFFISLLGLVAWFYFQENRKYSLMMSRFFLGGFLVYLFSLAFADASLTYKLFVLFRDLIVLAAVSAGFNLFQRNKWTFVAMAAVTYGLMQGVYYEKLVDTFPEKRTPQDISTLSPPESSTNSYAKSWDENGEILLDLREATDFKELGAIIDKYGLTAQRAFHPKNESQTNLDDYVVVNVPNKHLSRLSEIISELEASSLVDYAEGNETILLDPMEVTPLKKSKRKYAVNDPDVDRLWGFDAMGVDKLYNYLQSKKIKPKKKARIFILDTGVDAQHEDIGDNYKSVKKSYDRDRNGHGTHCAGVAASVSNNNKGVASLSLNNEFVEVTSIKVLADFGGGTQQGIIKGMLEAADKGADVISMSLGGRSNPAHQKAYSEAVAYANKAGAIMVVAAGNSNRNAKDFAPANAKGVITVAAIDTALNKASFSNYVTDIDMGIAAPGVAIYSSMPGNKYASLNGTSMATPYVAGLAGLLKSIKPDLTTKQLYNILKKSGKKLKDSELTGNLIQADKAVKALR